MAIETADIVTRVAERLGIVQEGSGVESADRVTIERAIDDAYYQLRTELRFSWGLDDIPRENVGPLSICVAAYAASGTNAPNIAAHEAKWDFGEKQLRIINRQRPQNHIPVEVEDF